MLLMLCITPFIIAKRVNYCLVTASFTHLAVTATKQTQYLRNSVPPSISIYQLKTAFQITIPSSSGALNSPPLFYTEHLRSALYH